jgi:hypothetical protein
MILEVLMEENALRHFIDTVKHKEKKYGKEKRGMVTLS